MSPFKQFEQHWVDRAKATSLLLAHEENAEWVEDTMQTFAAELQCMDFLARIDSVHAP